MVQRAQKDCARPCRQQKMKTHPLFMALTALMTGQDRWSRHRQGQAAKGGERCWSDCLFEGFRVNFWRVVWQGLQSSAEHHGRVHATAMCMWRGEHIKEPGAANCQLPMPTARTAQPRIPKGHASKGLPRDQGLAVLQCRCLHRLVEETKNLGIVA